MLGQVRLIVIGSLNQALVLLVPRDKNFTEPLRNNLLFKSLVFFQEIIPFNKEERISIKL